MRLSHLIAGVAALLLATMQPINAEDAVNTSVYVVTYFEVAPPAAAQSATLAQYYADVSRKEAGSAAYEVLAEIGRRNRLAIVEAWRDEHAYETHDVAASTTAFREKLQPLLISGAGGRVLSGFSVAAPIGRPGRQAVYVLTHVDVPPPQKDQAIELLKALSAAARKDNGNLWFDVLQQNDRPNHFTLFEGWHNRRTFDASIMAAHTKEFRQKLNPLEGALYDERLYQAVR
jgi:quinol monooxygenase YgiN